MKFTNLEINIEMVEGIDKAKIIQMYGELDSSNFNEFLKYVEEKVFEDKDIIILDFEKIKFIDSSGHFAIFNLYKAITKRGGDIKMFGLNPYIKNVLSELGIFKILPMYDSLEEIRKEISK